MSEERAKALWTYDDILAEAALDHGNPGVLEATKQLCLADLFFLLVHVLGRADMNRDWLFDRCREVENDPDGHLDLWARDHYKSTIITFGLTIQDVLKDPEITVGIFSHTRPIAKGFLVQIKREFEQNAKLKELFPDVLWQNPAREAPKWSEDDGIIVKRAGNPKESTIEAWGLVDGQPTSRHYKLLVFDDVVTRESVTTTDQIKKVTGALELAQNLSSSGGRKRYIGTRYHFRDTYGTIIERESAKPRIYPATDNGREDGAPVLLTVEELKEKRRDMGPYTFGCLASGTQILMGDWSVRPIESVREGDIVVGWTMEPGKRAKLVPTSVVATQHHRADTLRLSMAGGQNLECTPDHKWWTGRRKEDRGREVYRPAGLAYNETSALCKVLDLTDNHWPSGPRVIEAAAYLAGIFDGEGTVSGGAIHISQCERTHPKVCDRIRLSLEMLGFDFVEHRPSGREHQIDFYIGGGRQEKFRFLMMCDPAKREQVSQSMFGARNFGKKTREDIVSVEPGARQMVYNLQTETGNYVANGYCSKNCQMLQNPRADMVQGFDESWLRRWAVKSEHWERMNRYIIVDPANEKKEDSDYTTLWVVGCNSDRCFYVIDGFRDRLNLSERTKRLFKFHRKYKPLMVVYEQYGMQSDIQHIEYVMDAEGYHFAISKIGGNVPKLDRIRRLVPVFEQGRIYLPQQCHFTDYEGRLQDLTTLFVREEYGGFPVCVHDDMLDALARLEDPAMNIVFPSEEDAVVYTEAIDDSPLFWADRRATG